MDSLAVAFPVRIPFLFLVLKTMEKKETCMLNSTPLAICFVNPPAIAMETDTRIASFSINMNPSQVVLKVELFFPLTSFGFLCTLCFYLFCLL